ncbi:MAG: hypothetical protein J6Y85_05550 [Alphaproteobacteria bacterium]|nr:hypothetical protein [Alphaproteobacteria bacterium]
MELQEYHTKRLLYEAGLPVFKGRVAYSADEAASIVKKIGGNAFAVKIQQMGNVPFYGQVIDEKSVIEGACFGSSAEEVAVCVSDLLKKQSDWAQSVYPLSEVQKVYIEQVPKKYRDLGRFIFRVNFEKRVEVLTITTKDGRQKTFILQKGFDSTVKTSAVAFWKLQNDTLKSRMGVVLGRAYQLFKKYGAVAVELGPVLALDGDKLAITDGRLVFDPTSMFRFPELVPMIEARLGKEREMTARQNDFKYLGMRGNIACVVNGLSLGWATVDLVQNMGGKVGALLDVGIEPSKQAVAKALKLVLSEPNLDGVLVNMFGGQTRCDLIAEGLIAASPEIATGIPFVVCLRGTNDENGKRLLFESKLPFVVVSNMTDAARTIVRQVKEAG